MAYKELNIVFPIVLRNCTGFLYTHMRNMFE